MWKHPEKYSKQVTKESQIRSKQVGLCPGEENLIALLHADVVSEQKMTAKISYLT